jgi:hypothetical protein
MTKIGSVRVTKRDWYANGGFRNSSCWRRQVRGVWHYYINVS